MRLVERNDCVKKKFPSFHTWEVIHDQTFPQKNILFPFGDLSYLQY